MKKTKKRFSSDYHTKIWNPIFSTDRIPNEAKSYVEGRRGHQAEGEGIALFLYDSENSKSCKTQVVEDFCHDVCLEDIRRGSGNAGRRRAAWLDDRCKANGAPAGGHVRTYKNPMTPTAVLRHMEEVVQNILRLLVYESTSNQSSISDLAMRACLMLKDDYCKDVFPFPMIHFPDDDMQLCTKPRSQLRNRTSRDSAGPPSPCSEGCHQEAFGNGNLDQS
jgi:hypothetical protein